MKRAITLLIVAVTISIVTTSAQAPAQTITVERGPCLGTCPVYRFSVSADGTGLFEGRKFTTALGEHRFMVTPEAWVTFQAALAPYRPNGSDDWSSTLQADGLRPPVDIRDMDRWKERRSPQFQFWLP